MSQSEVARIRAQIELECEAMERGFRGFAITARHDFINHRMSQIGACQEQLEVLVGEDEARKIVAETYKQVMETGENSKVAKEANDGSKVAKEAGDDGGTNQAGTGSQAGVAPQAGASPASPSRHLGDKPL